MSFHSTRSTVAKGSTAGAGRSPRVMIGFEPALFDRIVGEAARRRVPFAQIVRERLIEAYRSVEDSKARASSRATSNSPSPTQEATE